MDSYFKSHDNHRLYYETHLCKKAKGAVILVHGLNEHAGRYEHVIECLNDDFSVFLFDHRGHGRSDGARSHVNAFSEYVDDLHHFVTMHKKHQPLFVVGHSMGGQVVLNYLHSYPKDPIAGFVTSSANIRVKIKINALKRFLGVKLSNHVPRLKLPNDIDPKWVCSDPVVVNCYKNDPLIGKNISVKLAAEILKNQEEILNYAPKIKIPALMMHAGDDRICDKAGSEDFFERLASKDKELVIYEGMYHEIFNEIENDMVLEKLKSWLLEHA